MIEPWMVYVAVLGISSLAYAVYVIHQKFPSFFTEVFKSEIIKVKIPNRCRVKKGENPFFKVIPSWKDLGKKVEFPDFHDLNKSFRDVMDMIA